MKKLMLGLMMAFAVTAARAEVKTNVRIGDLIYILDAESKTATIMGYDRGNPPTKVDVAEVEWEGQKYAVTSVAKGGLQGCPSLTSVYLPNATTIGESAFYYCDPLTSVYLPNATTIGQSAFEGCGVLSSLVVNSDMAAEIEKNGKSYYSIRSTATITVFEPLSEEVVKAARYEVKEAVVDVKITPSSVILKSGDLVLDKELYEVSCATYDYTPETEPETPYTPKEEDFKFVPPSSVVVAKESIAAPSAGTVKVEDNKVQLGVTVLKTSDLTAEKKEWNPVKLTKADIDVDADGNIIVNVPVDSSSGFMVIQTKDAAK